MRKQNGCRVAGWRCGESADWQQSRSLRPWSRAPAAGGWDEALTRCECDLDASAMAFLSLWEAHFYDHGLDKDSCDLNPAAVPSIPLFPKRPSPCPNHDVELVQAQAGRLELTSTYSNTFPFSAASPPHLSPSPHPSPKNSSANRPQSATMIHPEQVAEMLKKSKTSSLLVPTR